MLLDKVKVTLSHRLVHFCTIMPIPYSSKVFQEDILVQAPAGSQFAVFSQVIVCVCVH